MGAVANEPSMEDILSSIKRIIADGSDRTPPARNAKRRPAAVGDSIAEAADAEDRGEAGAADDQDESAVLELTDAVAEEDVEPAAILHSIAPVEAESVSPMVPPVIDEPDLPAGLGIISDRSAQAARQSLSHLSSLLVRPEDGESNTLEGMVREMLKPMLKQWLDERLPELVEAMVKKEIDRITGRLG